MPKRIIIIDNDLLILEMMQEALEQEGYKITIVQHTKNVIDLVLQHKADLVILDYILEGINGGELCRQLKTRHETAHLPVIICSGYSRILGSLGFYDCDIFLEKPFSLTELTKHVEKLIGLAKIDPSTSGI